MGKLYHGSLERGITRLEPHKSTHGKYVYATPYKELAIIFQEDVEMIVLMLYIDITMMKYGNW